MPAVSGSRTKAKTKGQAKGNVRSAALHNSAKAGKTGNTAGTAPKRSPVVSKPVVGKPVVGKPVVGNLAKPAKAGKRTKGHQQTNGANRGKTGTQTGQAVVDKTGKSGSEAPVRSAKTKPAGTKTAQSKPAGAKATIAKPVPAKPTAKAARGQAPAAAISGRHGASVKDHRPASAIMPLNGARNGLHTASGSSGPITAQLSIVAKGLHDQKANGTSNKIGPSKSGSGKNGSGKIGQAVRVEVINGPATRAVNGREANGAMQHDGNDDKDADGLAGITVATRAKPAASGAGVKSGVKAADRTADAKRNEIVLAPTYKPAETEPFMNASHRLYFRLKLLKWKEDIVRQNMETLKVLHDDSSQQADPADRATAETDRALELRARDRQRKLMGKIDSALARIEEGSYGFCEETGEPISLKRLDARPIATLSLEAQERRERRERIFRDD